jgi:DNA-binding GntR family transcriptional regulator
LERGDGDEAERLMQRHIEAACKDFLSALDADAWPT